MAKYSTGGESGSGEGGACELCGSVTDRLTDANIAGASLQVCQECAPHDDRGPAGSGRNEDRSDDRDAGRRAAQQTAKLADAQRTDPDYWVEHGTDYEGDQLPYLASGYGGLVQDARQDAGYTVEELAEELGADVDAIDAVEQGRATRAGVGGSVIQALEALFDIDLVEE